MYFLWQINKLKLKTSASEEYGFEFGLPHFGHNHVQNKHLAWNHESHTLHWFVAWLDCTGLEQMLQMLQRCLSPGLSSISPPTRRSNIDGMDLSLVRRHKRMSFLAEWASRWITSIQRFTASFHEKEKPNVKPGIPLWFITVYSSLEHNFCFRTHVNKRLKFCDRHRWPLSVHILFVSAIADRTYPFHFPKQINKMRLKNNKSSFNF